MFISASAAQIVILIGDGTDCTLEGQQKCSLGVPGGRRHDSLQRVLAEVEKRQQKIEKESNRVAIFTLTVKGGDDSLGRQLACGNGGVWTELGR